MKYQGITGDLKFREAFNVWLSHREIKTQSGVVPIALQAKVRYLKETSLDDLRDCASALEKFFGRLALEEIHPGHLMAYQNARALCDISVCQDGKWAKPCGATRLRKEVQLMIRLLTAARLWSEEQEQELVKIRDEERDVPRAMSVDQQETLLQTAGSREEWHLLLWYSLVGLQTAAATNELRDLRIGDISIGCRGSEMIEIRWASAKNKYRVRAVPLEGPSIWAMERLLERAHRLGSRSPHHYLLPFREAVGRWVPTKPICDTTLNKPWRGLREQAGIPWLRLYDLRHTGITRMAEAGVPIDVAMSLVGHMTMQMHNRYVEIQQGSKRKWMRAAWGDPAGAESLPPAKPPMPMNQFGNGFTQKIARRA